MELDWAGPGHRKEGGREEGRGRAGGEGRKREGGWEEGGRHVRRERRRKGGTEERREGLRNRETKE